MIILHTGKIGEGKSYSCTWEIFKHILNGTDVYCNWAINFNEYLKHLERSMWWRMKKLARYLFGISTKPLGKLYYFNQLEEIYGIKNGQIYIDEAHKWLNAKQWQNIPPEFITKMSQSRKYKTDLHFITQHPGMIFNDVRRLCNEWIDHYKFFNLLCYKAYDAKYIDKYSSDPSTEIKSRFQGWIWFRKRFAQTYNTFEIIGEQFTPFSKEPIWSYDRYLDWLQSNKKLTIRDRLRNLFQRKAISKDAREKKSIVTPLPNNHKESRPGNQQERKRIRTDFGYIHR